MANGYIFYEGPSLIDGAPIVGIATGFEADSTNSKTGGMLQTWIMRADIEPTKALGTGDDVSVCGNCKHRSSSCYVATHMAPLVIWKAYKRGIYPKLASTTVISNVRFGSYGDPAAIPKRIWSRLLSRANNHTAYTHQWRDLSALRSMAMASVDTEAEAYEAQAKGWRTFRVRLPHEPLLSNEIMCPASKEAGQRTTCNDCNLCSGNYSNGKNIAIIVHGSPSKVKSYIRKNTHV